MEYIIAVNEPILGIEYVESLHPFVQTAISMLWRFLDEATDLEDIDMVEEYILADYAEGTCPLYYEAEVDQCNELFKAGYKIYLCDLEYDETLEVMIEGMHNGDSVIIIERDGVYSDSERAKLQCNGECDVCGDIEE